VTVDFTDADYKDFTYELNDGELVNDVLCIVGEPDAEVLVRGYDAGSIAKYGRRSYRLDNPIVANVEAAYATPKAQVTAILDRNIEPYAAAQITVISKTDALTVKLLGLEISDLVRITQATCGLIAAYFITESIDLSVDTLGIITASIGLVQARAGEHP
jgi:phosphoribosylaminoimidazole-succinocarboxamide synthase